VTKYLRNAVEKEERFALAHDLRGFSSWLVDSVGFGHLTKQNIVAGSAWWSKATHLMVDGK
jgi:hypothetical protein